MILPFDLISLNLKRIIIEILNLLDINIFYYEFQVFSEQIGHGVDGRPKGALYIIAKFPIPIGHSF